MGTALNSCQFIWLCVQIVAALPGHAAKDANVTIKALPAT
jgi:hypothetical protein